MDNVSGAGLSRRCADDAGFDGLMQIFFDESAEILIICVICVRKDFSGFPFNTIRA